MSIQPKKLISVSEVMLPLASFPVIPKEMLFKEALEIMGKKHLGIACIVDENSSLLGILTDGDLRRKVLRIQKPFSALLAEDVLDVAITSPLTILEDADLTSAIELMGEKQVWDLPVLNSKFKLVGLLHLHPAIKAISSQF
jgi:arabinose-5-phosphate isomerase